jgi:hypothetical protein
VPPGNKVVLIESDEGAALTTMLSDFVAVSALASVTLTVKVLVPVPVGVPEITPVVEARASPAGNVPEVTDQVYGAVPPVATTVAM